MNMNKAITLLAHVIFLQSAIAGDVAPLNHEYRPGQIEFDTLMSQAAKLPPNVKRQPNTDFSQLVSRMMEIGKKIGKEGPTPDDWALSTQDEKTVPTKTCFRAAVMTKTGMLNIKECLDRLASIDEAVNWYESNNQYLSSPIDNPGRMFFKHSNKEVLSFFYNPSTKKLYEVVVFTTSIK